MSSEQCAVCDEQTAAPERWGRTVCEDCSSLSVLFAVSCGVCGWSTTTTGNERNRGGVKQMAQMYGNNHEKEESLNDESPDDHPTAVWEMDHPDREEHVPSEVEDA